MTYKEIKQEFLTGLKQALDTAREQGTGRGVNPVLITVEIDQFTIPDSSVDAHIKAVEVVRKDSAILRDTSRFFKVTQDVEVDVEGYGSPSEIEEVTGIYREVVVRGYRFITDEEYEKFGQAIDDDSLHYSSNFQHAFTNYIRAAIGKASNKSVQHAYIDCKTLRLYRQGRITWDVLKDIVVGGC